MDRTAGRCVACTELTSLVLWGTWNGGYGAGSAAGDPHSSPRAPQLPTHSVWHFWHISQGWSGKQKVPFLQAHCVFSWWGCRDSPPPGLWTRSNTALLGLSHPLPNAANNPQAQGSPACSPGWSFTLPTCQSNDCIKAPTAACKHRHAPKPSQSLLEDSHPSFAQGMLCCVEMQTWKHPLCQLRMQPAPSIPSTPSMSCSLGLLQMSSPLMQKL